MKRKTPSLRLHKATGQAFVELNGQRIYLGRHDLPETRQKYHRTVAEWLANGRQVPVAPEEFTVAELVNAYRKHATEYYRRSDGSSTTEPENIKLAMQPLLDLYADATCASIGPRQLKAIRAAMVEKGWGRHYVNKQVSRIRRAVRWAAESELIPPSAYHALLAVTGLKMGRTEAPESEPIRPVADSIVDATLPYMTPTVRAMVQVQRHTGMRPGEAVLLRGCDLDRSGPVWLYKPARHKTQHLGRAREIAIGPKAQGYIQPYLGLDLTAYAFSPAKSEEERQEARAAARVTPLSCGNRPGTNRKRRRQNPPKERYDSCAYARAVLYACERAFPPPAPLARAEGETRAAWRKRLKLEGKAGELRQWAKDHWWAPNQLRHSFATEVRKQFGLQAAQVMLGHARADVTQVYAEVDAGQRVVLAAKIG